MKEAFVSTGQINVFVAAIEIYLLTTLIERGWAISQNRLFNFVAQIWKWRHQTVPFLKRFACSLF
jgi:hypothetical protein